MIPRLIDTHCHLHFPAYDEDRDAVLSRMREKKIAAITVGTSLRTSEEGIRFAEEHDGVWATVGYHPEHLTSSYHDASEGPPDAFDAHAIRKLATSSSKIVAIGETGLDFFRIDKDRDQEEARRAQEDAFREHLKIARELDKPIVIHCRDAFQRLAEIISEIRVPGVVHCFTGSWEDAQPLLDLGLHLSFTGIVTFPPKKTDNLEKHVHRVIERMPLERLLVETDAPWLTPIPHRGEKNEPTYVEFVARKIAELRHASLDEIAARTTENAIKLFRLTIQEKTATEISS